MAKIFVILWMVFEVFSISINYMSASNGVELGQHRENKDRAIERTNELKQDKILVKNSGIKESAKVYRMSQINDEIKSLSGATNLVLEANETSYYKSIGGLIGIDSIEPIYRTMLSALLVLAATIMLKQRASYYCNLSLAIFAISEIVQNKIMDKLDTKNKTTSTTGVKKSGSATDTATGEDKVKADYKAALTWVKQWEHDQVFKAPQLRQSMTSTKRTQQNIVVQLLIKNGEIKRKKNGTAYEYRRV